MFTPIVIPTFHRSSPPPPCPKCHRPEDTVSACRNCGYQYADSDGWPAWVVTPLVLIIIWAAITVICWTADQSLSFTKRITLVQFVGNQFSEIWDLLTRIW